MDFHVLRLGDGYFILFVFFFYILQAPETLNTFEIEFLKKSVRFPYKFTCKIEENPICRQFAQLDMYVSVSCHSYLH